MSLTRMPTLPTTPAQFVRVEAAALARLAARMEADLHPAIEHALALIASHSAAGRRVAVTGVGKSGIIARKIAATLSSTGTAACFLHPTEALHGDLGMLAPGDLVIALSYSGETEELLRLLPAFARMGLPVLAMTGCPGSTLAGVAAVTLDVSVDEEACSLGLAPTASTTVMLALGDALALELSRRSGFEPQNFANLHPGGRLGQRLARVSELMHAGDALPSVLSAASLAEVIHEMSRKKLGITTVLEPGPSGQQRLAGIIADGDLRRLLEREGPAAIERSAGEVMHRSPQTITPEAFGSEALAQMEAHKITSLVVVESGIVQGVVHLHDLWQLAPR